MPGLRFGLFTNHVDIRSGTAAPSCKFAQVLNQFYVLSANGRNMTFAEAEDFCEFCRKHTRDVVGNRLTEERLDFVYHFVFPPSHAELLPVRESKKERNAYGAQMEEAGNQRFGPDASGESREVLDRIA